MRRSRLAIRKLTTGDERRSQSAFGTHKPNAVQRLLIALGRRSPFNRGLFRRRVSQLIMAAGGNRPLDITFRDCSYRLFGGRNLIETGILLSPNYNAADIDFLIEGAAPGASFVDIGSHMGLYTLSMARKASPGGLAIAVDANPMMTERLAFNATASGLDNVCIFACGLGDREGRAALQIRKDDLAIVSIVDDPQGEIPVRTLASVVAEAGVDRIAGLKIDVEGYEDKVLVPFLETASDALLPRRIVIETMADGTDYPGCMALFARRGYRLRGRTRNNSLYVRDSEA